MMEDLIELVAASFVRHGIECPANDWPINDSPTDGSPAKELAGLRPEQAMAQIDPVAFPEHSYRKKPESGLAT
jgi:hypothetical protein